MALHSEAQRAAEFVAYEMNMAVDSIDRLIAGISGRWEENRALESLLTHARSLFYFFTTSRPRPTRFEDDILACDFFDDPPPWPSNASGMLTHLTAEYDRLNKSLPHLSYMRIQYEKAKHWDFGRIRHELLTTFARFYYDLPDHRREWFRPHLNGTPEPPASPGPAVRQPHWPSNYQAKTCNDVEPIINVWKAEP